jgi:hypothetical protein
MSLLIGQCHLSDHEKPKSWCGDPFPSIGKMVVSHHSKRLGDGLITFFDEWQPEFAQWYSASYDGDGNYAGDRRIAWMNQVDLISLAVPEEGPLIHFARAWKKRKLGSEEGNRGIKNI